MPEDKNKKDNLNDTENKELKDIEIELAEDISGNDNSDGSEKIASSGSSNTHLRRLISYQLFRVFFICDQRKSYSGA